MEKVCVGVVHYNGKLRFSMLSSCMLCVINNELLCVAEFEIYEATDLATNDWYWFSTSLANSSNFSSEQSSASTCCNKS